MQTLSKLKSYDNKEWHFSFAYPSEWKILWENEPADSWIIPIAIAGQEQSGGLPCFSVNARRGEILQEKEQVLVFPSTPQEYIKQEQEELKRAFPGFQLISAEELLLDNKPSARLVYSYDGVKGRIQEECTTLFGVGVTFQFISEVPARDSAQFAPVFKGIFESLRIGRSSSENSIKIEGNTEISVSQQVTLSPQPLGAAAALKQWKTKGKTPWLVGGAILLLGLGGIGFWQFQVLSDHWAWEASQQVNTINGFEQYLQKHPQGKYVTQANQKLADLYLNQGNERLDKEDFQGAIADYNKAIELDPNFALAYNNRGVVYYNLKQWQKALADYNQAIELDPNYALAYSSRGVVYSNLKQWQKALADYNQAIKLDPNLADAYIKRGWAYVNLNHWQKGIADLNKAIELDHDNALAYVIRGGIRAMQGDRREGRTDLRKAAQLYLQQGDQANYQATLNLLQQF
ncbi:MAG: tetratricopeptide repeat protein [Microcystis sp. LE19-84.1B]|uniref:tetratricopeptide repeat protein n=1 Tax=Microcystis sp. LE19-84.1B TaxID=3016438 RepID=UPI0022C5BD15|nr:tetratricopeptide repeat protein [Microcystis sp. LE19-84.1B]MCZ8224313.1 tetratricopeptide repeat protein [Microcystis sp. LE19-84.1B]